MRSFFAHKEIVIPLINLIVIIIVVVMMAFSFGWFSLNKEVKLGGANVDVNVPPNVLITAYNPPRDTSGDLPATFTLSQEEVSRYGFNFEAGFITTTSIYPVSYDGTTFRYANSIDTDGSAKKPSSGKTYSVVSQSVKNLFYVDQSFYITNESVDDILLELSRIRITQGTLGGEIYKAVRCELISSQDLTELGMTTSAITYKYADSENPEAGTCLPACGDDAKLSEDFAVKITDIRDEDTPSFRLLMPKMQYWLDADGSRNSIMTAVKVTLRIWVEGENPNAIVSYASTGFYISVDFDIVSKDE